MKNIYFLIALFLFNFALAQNPFITVWKTDNIGSSNNNQIRFYFTGQFNYYWEDISNPAINGNGTISGSPSATITFPSAGIYTVEIIPSSSFNMRIDGLDPLKLIEIQQWGNVNWNSMNGSFRACSNLEVTATDTPNLANVSNMNQIFAYCTSLNSIPFINSWDVSNVNNMSGLFLDTSFNSPIGNWNTTNVTNMSSMFQGNIYFNQPIGNWDMGNVNSLSRMFNGASSFNQEIGSWDVSNAVFMSGMFGGATSFNQPVNNWNVSNVRKMDSMFAQASSFNQPLDSWNVENVETMVAMFAYAGNFNQTLESWKIRCLYFPPNGLYNMFNFSGLDCENYSSTLAGWASDSNIGINQSLGSINIKYSSLGEDARNFLINSKGWNITGDEFDPECNVASPCDEPDFQPFKPAVPDLFSQIVEDELSDNQIHSIDKEYGDIDGDSDIDMLYVRGNKLHVLVNHAGAGNPPNFTVPGNEIMLNFPTIPDHPNYPGMEIEPVSYRLFDWDNDGDLDLILLAGKAAGTQRILGGVFLFLNDGNGNFPGAPSLLLDAMSFGDANGHDAQNDFPAEFFQFIEVGDMNNDGWPDLLVSGRNRIWGTAYFENTGTISNPAFNLAAPQQIVPNSNWTNWIQNIAFPVRHNAAVFPLPIPELFSTDCTEKQDLFISESWWYDGGGRVFYHENNGGITNGTLPDFDLNGLTNQFGLNDDAHSNYPNADFPTFNESPLNCYASVVRFVDYFGTGCPIAIVYNYCSKKFYYYNQNCDSMSISEVDSELTQNKSILLYPNPAKNEVNFFVNKEMKIYGIQIFDATGKLILQPKISDNKINTTHLNSGIYFLNFQTDKGSISEKLIIK